MIMELKTENKLQKALNEKSRVTKEEISVYYLQHFWSTDSDAHIRRGVLRTDGFVSLRADYSGGEFITKPLIFSGSRLVVNFSTGVAGSVQIEIQDSHGKALEGYHSDFYGDAIAHTVRWQDDKNLSKLAGKPIRLHFVMKDADLYSIQFCPDEE